MLTATPLRSKAAHLPTKASRCSGRSLFFGLTHLRPAAPLHEDGWLRGGPDGGRARAVLRAQPVLPGAAAPPGKPTMPPGLSFSTAVLFALSLPGAAPPAKAAAPSLTLGERLAREGADRLAQAAREQGDASRGAVVF